MQDQLCPRTPARAGCIETNEESNINMKILRPMKAIRANCLDCSGTAKAVAYCPCDGLNSTRCANWSYRFGKRPETVQVELGKAMVTPELMPGSDVDLESLPSNPRHYQPLPPD
jgi:hypothetical protein